MTPISGDSVKQAAQTRLLGNVVHYWEQVDSTNATLGRLLTEGASEGTASWPMPRPPGKAESGSRGVLHPA